MSLTCFSICGEPKAVMTMTGRVGKWLWTWAISARPSISGMRRSVTSRAISCALRMFSASRPLGAVSVLNLCFFSYGFSPSATLLRKSFSSSTIRMDLIAFAFSATLLE